jgi:hypothetical protein
MIGTIDAWFLNMEAIVLIIAFDLAMFVEFECHRGNGIFCPELSNLIINSFARPGGGNLLHGPILATRSTVQVNDNFQTVTFGPGNCFHKVWQLALYVGFTRTDFERPVSNGEPYMIES